MAKRVAIKYKSGKWELVEMPREVTLDPNGWVVIYGVGEKDLSGKPYPDRTLVNKDLIELIMFD